MTNFDAPNPRNDNKSELRVIFPKAEIVRYLRGKFAKFFKTMREKSVDFEQRLLLVRKHSGTLQTYPSELVEVDTVHFSKKQTKADQTPIIDIHTHPYSIGYINDVPSLDDFYNSYTELDYALGNIVFYVNGILICNRKNTLWLWQLRSKEDLEKVERAYKDWESGIIDRVTHRDIEDLKQLLFNTGIKLLITELDQGDIAESFAKIIEDSDFEFGHL